jgi:hypothetical protein
MRNTECLLKAVPCHDRSSSTTTSLLIPGYFVNLAAPLNRLICQWALSGFSAAVFIMCQLAIVNEITREFHSGGCDESKIHRFA